MSWYMTAYFQFSFSFFYTLSDLTSGWWQEGLLFLPVAHFTLYLISRLSPWLFVSRWKNLARISLYPRVVFHSSESRSVRLWHSSNARRLHLVLFLYQHNPLLMTGGVGRCLNSRANLFRSFTAICKTSSWLFSHLQLFFPLYPRDLGCTEC